MGHNQPVSVSCDARFISHVFNSQRSIPSALSIASAENALERVKNDLRDRSRDLDDYTNSKVLRSNISHVALSSQFYFSHNQMDHGYHACRSNEMHVRAVYSVCLNLYSCCQFRKSKAHFSRK